MESADTTSVRAAGLTCIAAIDAELTECEARLRRLVRGGWIRNLGIAHGAGCEFDEDQERRRIDCQTRIGALRRRKLELLRQAIKLVG